MLEESISSVKSIKINSDKLLKTLHGQYQPMQVYLRADFSSPTQASFFLTCVSHSTGAGYKRPAIQLVMP